MHVGEEGPLCRREEGVCVGGVPFIYLEGEQITTYRWAREGGRKGNLFYILAETDMGGKCLSFCDREDAPGMVS